ncbi:uncharacterized protein BDZ83DRAFT_605327 [Colletotrichum acutatum]|uniref:Uncharacterized protein n=1 Tax=Glomerella acutata TaxID=27357 RepID=A0AAD8XLA1_GLOAC|nr:uncharacterized protein BDZ83DRAFT_605327 [Colletotrichum acutatum]KAK1729497.1 hypothetical protein BDZ83DRAFT_605327 [Colletotrichum acutatum]
MLSVIGIGIGIVICRLLLSCVPRSFPRAMNTYVSLVYLVRIRTDREIRRSAAAELPTLIGMPLIRVQDITDSLIWWG